MSHSIDDLCDGCGSCVRLCPVGAVTGGKKTVHIIDGSLCIDCGACGRVCPRGAIRDPFGIVCAMVKRSLWPKPRFEKKLCMSCGICREACPVRCLGVEAEVDPADPHPYPFLADERACMACGFCADACPVGAVIMAAPP